MFGIDAIAGLAGGLSGGGGGGKAPSSTKQSQDGNTLSSGGGGFNVGGGTPKWVWPVLLGFGGVGLLVFLWKKL